MSTQARLLNGQYALGASPRLGGMATVYKANDLRDDNRLVAVKLLNRGSGDPALLDRVFDREYRAVSRLDHPNIVRLLDGGSDQETGHRFLVFEWHEGSLEDELSQRRGQPWGWDDFSDRIGEGVLSALAHAHETGIAHRDVTPGNVLLDGDGTPRVADFGIAKIITDMAPGQTLADYRTEPYAPPGGEDYEFLLTRDVYSFGVVALVALSGINPYADLYKERARACIEDGLNAADAPAEVLAFLESCVARDPADRPRDANAALAELRAVGHRRAEAARAAGLVPTPTYSLRLTRKVNEALRLDFDVTTDHEVARIVLSDLGDEVGFLPFKSAAFDDGSSTDGHFELLGAELRMHVELEAGADHLVVRRVGRDSSSFLDRERERAYRLWATFQTEPPVRRESAAASLLELRRAIMDHAAERARAAKVEGQRRVFAVWRRALQAATQLERGKERPIAFSDYRRDGAFIAFTMPAAVPEELVGQKRVTELMDGGLLAGEIARTTDEGLVLRVEHGEPRELPRRGKLRVDTRMGRAALRRQDVALDVVQRRAALRPDLEQLLVSPAAAREPSPVRPTAWVQANLDEPKRQAVEAALGATDLVLVEGPPGTGKTTFITELICQELQRNPSARVLVSSQTHAALDNVLERLLVLGEDLALLRLGRPGDERISARVGPLLMGQQLERWRREVIRDSRSHMRAWAKQHGLSERDVEIAMRLEDLASLAAVAGKLAEQSADADERLERLRVQRRQGVETANETVRTVQDELVLLEQERQDMEAARTDQLVRLKEIGAIATSDELNGLSAEELRDRAETVVDRDHPAFGACQSRLRLLADWHGRFGHGPEFEAAALVRAQVVAATCVGFGGTAGWDSVEFDLCIVDEASKATATETLIPLARARRWVLVGDHRQLPPYVDEALLDHEVLREHGLTEEEVRETLFERLRRELPEQCRFMLSMQHRMLPAIGDLISACFYKGELGSADAERPGWLAMALAEPVVWQTTAQLGQRRERRAGTSYSNPLEAQCIGNLLGSLNLVAGSAGERLSIGVLSGYLEQRDELERRVARSRTDWPHLDVECNTVDAFQGREVDVAIYSLTRSNAEGKLGFLHERRRLNVALSRGRLGLVIVGDDHFAATASGDNNPFAAVLTHIRSSPGCCVEEARP